VQIDPEPIDSTSKGDRASEQPQPIALQNLAGDRSPVVGQCNGKGNQPALLKLPVKSSAPLLEKWTEKLACSNFNSSSYVSRVRHQLHFQPQPRRKQQMHC